MLFWYLSKTGTVDREIHATLNLWTQHAKTGLGAMDKCAACAMGYKCIIKHLKYIQNIIIDLSLL